MCRVQSSPLRDVNKVLMMGGWRGGEGPRGGAELGQAGALQVRQHEVRGDLGGQGNLVWESGNRALE